MHESDDCEEFVMFQNNTKWFLFANTLPVKRTSIVRSKYVYSLLFVSILMLVFSI